MNDDPANGRFFIIQMMRLSGLALVVVGLSILNGVIEAPEIAGYAVLAIGLLDALFMPTFLARRWKSPPP
jgi:hypothetical protein